MDKNRVVAEVAPPKPAWDREVDVTLSINPIPAFEGGAILSRAVHQIPEDVAEAAILKTARETGSLESHTYTAIVSSLNYIEKRRDPIDDVFCRIVVDMYQSCLGDAIIRFSVAFISRFPAKIRRRIWGFVASDDPDKDPKPVRMQPFNPFFKDVWEPENFRGIRELFDRVEGALSTCLEMRIDVLASIFTTHRFHFLFSPFVKQNTCPQIFHWMDQYSHYMEMTTVEVDLSKLGFGPTPEAGDLLWGDRNIVAAMRRFVDVQVARRPVPLSSLVLLARRYHGLRPAQSGEGALRPYCPPEADFSIVARIVKLRTKIKLLRMAGFNTSTTNTIIGALFPNVGFRDQEEANKHCSREDVCGIWPFLPGQGSVHYQAKYPHPKRMSATESPPTPDGLTTPNMNVSMARKQITKLRDMLEAQEAKKTRSREASFESNNEGTKRTGRDSSTPARRGTTRLSSSSKGSKASQCSSESKRSMLNLNNDASKPEQLTEPERRKSYVSTISTAKPVEDTINSASRTPKVSNPADSHIDIAKEEKKRASQASTTSTQSNRSVRWSDDRTDEDRDARDASPQSARSNRTIIKTMSIPVWAPKSGDSDETRTLRKRASASELRRKKSFGDFLRSSSRTEMCDSPGAGGRSRRSKTPGPNSSRVLSNLTGVTISGGYAGTYL